MSTRVCALPLDRTKLPQRASLTLVLCGAGPLLGCKTMATAQALQNLQDEFHKVADLARTTQNNLQHLRSAKKEADINKRRSEVLTSLKTMQDRMTQLQEHMQESQTQLQDAVGQKEDSAGQEQAQQGKRGIKPAGIIEARHLSPEQQETLYEFKSSRMGAMQSQNHALKKELQLNQHKKQLLEARYAATQSYSGSETLRAAHALEAKLRGANLKIKGLEDELRKSQQMALRYRELYEDSQRQSESDRATPNRHAQQSKSAPPKVKPAPLKEQAFIGPNTNVNDVVRKNECLLEENEVLKREIQRLKRDNAELILIAKTAAADRDMVLARLGTSDSARQDLQKRYHKLKNENTQLSRSFTRQAAGWIEWKRQHQYAEINGRWGEIHPVAPHGATDRYREHSQRENTSMPRGMFPVERYGETSTA